MDLGRYITQLREDLGSAAAAGDEQTRRTAALLGAAIEPAARLALMNALADLAAEVTAALGDREVDVRLDGRDVRVAVSPHPAAEPEPEPAGPPPRPGGMDAGDISRITLRLVEQIKSQAEHAAAAQGVSLNQWVAQAVQGRLTGGRRGFRGDWQHGDRQHGDRQPGDRPGDRPGGDDREGRLRGWVEGE
jgi:HicB family